MRKKLAVIVVLVLFAVNLYPADIVVKYPDRDGVGEAGFGFQLLKLVLEKLDKPYKVELHEDFMNQDRALAELENGRLSVVDTGVGPEFESRFDAVYIPIDMGLTGWRIFIIHKAQKGDFAKIKTLEQLKTKTCGQGSGWTDGKIIESSGIKVMTAPKIELLIRMVDGQRFDFFPLGANETHGFLAQFGKGKPNLIIEDTITLVYPFARLYYVRKGDKELHDDIEKGLETAYKDGSFEKFILNHPFFKEGLDKSDLKNRTVIRIDNPFMTEEFKKIDPKWWYKVH